MEQECSAEDDHIHCLYCIHAYCDVKPVDKVSCTILSCDQDCGARFHACKLSEHRKLCSRQRVSCINVENGCPLVMMRSQLGVHLETCPASVIHCTMEWNRWPVYSTERFTRVPFNPNIKTQCGQLDVALALRDQRKLDEALRAPRKTRQVLRNNLTRRFPAVPLQPRSSTYIQDYSSNETSKTVSDDDSDAPWEVRKNPPGLQSSVSKQLHKGSKMAADSLKKALSVVTENEMMPMTKEQKQSLLAEVKENHNSACSVDYGALSDGAVISNLANHDVTSSLPKLQNHNDKAQNLDEDEAQPQPDYLSFVQSLHPEDSSQNATPHQCLDSRTAHMDFTSGAETADANVHDVNNDTMSLIPPPNMKGVLGLDFTSGAETYVPDVCKCMFTSPPSPPPPLHRPAPPTTTTTTKMKRVLGLDFTSGAETADTNVHDVNTDTISPLPPKMKGDLGLDFTSGAKTAVTNGNNDAMSPIISPPPPPPPPKMKGVLGLDLHVESITRYQAKPKSMYTFLCAQEFRRDEYPWHLKNLHADIHSGLNGWLEQRCPLAHYGCTFSIRRFHPTHKGADVVHSCLLESFGIRPNVDECRQRDSSPAVDTNNADIQNIYSEDKDTPSIDNDPIVIHDSPCEENISDNNKQVTTMLHEQENQPSTVPDFSQYLPFEILQCIARCLDSFSLCNLALTCARLRDVCCSLLEERGIVVQQWEKTGGRPKWSIVQKVSALQNLNDAQCFLTNFFLCINGKMMVKNTHKKKL